MSETLFSRFLNKAIEGVCCNGEPISPKVATVIIERFWKEVANFFVECDDVRKRQPRSFVFKGIGALYLIPHKFRIKGETVVRKTLRFRISPDLRREIKEMDNFIYDEVEIASPGTTFVKVDSDE